MPVQWGVHEDVFCAVRSCCSQLCMSPDVVRDNRRQWLCCCLSYRIMCSSICMQSTLLPDAAKKTDCSDYMHALQGVLC